MSSTDAISGLVPILITSLGGTGVIIVGVSAFISKIMNSYLSKRIEHSFDTRLNEAKSDIALRQEYIQKKRDLYASLIQSMRVFVEGTHNEIDQQKALFLSNYDSCMLWASDEVIRAIGEYLDVQTEFSKTKNADLQKEMKRRYSICLVKMRNDCGFQETGIGESDYRFVSF
jgi:hypothetical protein